MRDNIKFRFMGILAMLATCAVFAVAVMLLWNALLPQIFALPQVSYLQAAGLLILARLLFGGIGGDMRGHAGHRGMRRGEHPFDHGNKLREKWMNMSEEERKEFMEKEKGGSNFFHERFSHHRDPFNNDERERKDEGNE
jgi:hypothetical protein